MKENNPNLQTWIEPELEARVVAWVLGEASEFEAAELERVAAEKPELAVFKRRIEAVHGLIGTAMKPEAEPLRLSAERRAALLEKIGAAPKAAVENVTAIPQKKSRGRWRIVIEVAACFAIVAVLLGLLFPALNTAKESARKTRVLADSGISDPVAQHVSGNVEALALRELRRQPTMPAAEPVAPVQQVNQAQLARQATESSRRALADISHNLASSDMDGGAGFQQPASKGEFPVATQEASGNISGVRQNLGDFAGRELAKNEGVASRFYAGDVQDEKLNRAPLEEAPASSMPEEKAGVDRKLSFYAKSDASPQSRELVAQLGQTLKDAEAPINAPAVVTEPSRGVVAERRLAEPEYKSKVRERVVAVNGGNAYSGGTTVAAGTVVATGSAFGVDQPATGSGSVALNVKSPANRADFGYDIAGGRGSGGTDGSGRLADNQRESNADFDGGAPIQSTRIPGNVSGLSGPATVASPAVPVLGDVPVAGKLAKKESDALGWKDDKSAESTTPASDLEKQFTEQRKRVELAAVDAAKLRESQQIVDLNPETFESAETPETRRGISNQDKADQMRAETTKLRAQVEQLEKLKPEELMVALRMLEIDDPTVMKTLPQYQEAAAEEARLLSSGVSKDDEKVAALERQRTGYAGQLDDAVRALRSSLGTKLKIAEATLEQLDARQESSNADLLRKKAAPTKKLNLEEITRDELSAADQPFSTFSLHVSDVSFRLAQAALAKGEAPDPESIRPEEFYNAFDYGDPAAAPGEKVTCNIEQCAHPFLQQRNLVRIAMRVPAGGRGKGTPLRLTVLLDTSGSMEREDRVASLRRAMEVLASLLGPDDRVTLIGFARQPRLLLDQLPGDQAAKLVEAVASTPSEGGTNLEEALRLAAEQALKQRAKAAQNRIVLLTDGAANLGNQKPESLARMIEKLRQQGVAFDACGVGAEGLNDEILEALTRKGDGRYYFLNTPADADAGFARQLAGAFRPAAQNVKVQVRFNPARVARYRLIGFEQHRLKKEDFRNDKVDAAELAAEEAAVALYQVEVLPGGDGELGEVSVRFRDATVVAATPSSQEVPAAPRRKSAAAGGEGAAATTGAEMVERSWTLSYDAQARQFDQAAPSMQLAGTAALLAEKLRGGAMANLVDLDALAPVVNSLRGHYADQANVQALVTMFRQMERMK